MDKPLIKEPDNYEEYLSLSILPYPLAICRELRFLTTYPCKLAISVVVGESASKRYPHFFGVRETWIMPRF